MPVSDTEKEILFHPPANLNQTPDSADPKKKAAPPARQVLRPSSEAPLSDVIRHQPATGFQPGSEQQSPPTAPSSPSLSPDAAAAAAAAEASASAEFAAAAARARAAINQQLRKSATQAADQMPPAGIPKARQSGVAPTPGRPAERRPPPKQQAPALPEQAAPRPPETSMSAAARPSAAAAPVRSVPEAPAPPEPMAPAQAPQRAQVLAEPPPAPQAQPETRPHRESGKTFLLHTHGLRKVYDGRAVVNGVEVTVRPSEIVGLLGPNGAGKTTTFYMIVGLIQPNGGRVTFNGKDATHEPMYRRARLGMGYLPQEESIFRKLSVEDNILAVMETQDIPRSERRDRCHELMKRFGIEKLARNEAITLSGGEKRRLTIARSLVTNPKLLMLDEPFSGVDPIAVGEIQEIVRSLREQGLAILITDHNVRETLDIVDRAYLLFEGRVEREGTRDFLINDPLSRQLYPGERFSM